jgi:hypothetical protein
VRYSDQHLFAPTSLLSLIFILLADQAENIFFFSLGKHLPVSQCFVVCVGSVASIGTIENFCSLWTFMGSLDVACLWHFPSLHRHRRSHAKVSYSTGRGDIVGQRNMCCIEHGETVIMKRRGRRFSPRLFKSAILYDSCSRLCFGHYYRPYW